ncbi:molybdopterin-dependent oxidoreductase [Paenalcaligenes niemegkensis]|uniref:molybdopterin cofactor-binding domain-containing protein n=1 Tax=Paenalcaligenes niemegkensis TaxID=2895469 RepID=UPI001EE7EA69|nr:molybdopterin cofactor-binding domain-containing protein [Paenalcaligenes niemegkensis]MCQ9617666.1 molybdopterin-dependent oxidoreductase [Paenalcaligenes niemegkensis]
MTFDLISRHAGTFPASTLTPSSRDLSPPSESHLLHGVSLRPPNWENEIQAQRTPQLLAVDSSRALLVPGVVTCVIKGGFVGIVAAQRHQAMQARGLLNASWATPVPSEATTLPSQGGQMPAPAAPSPQIQYSWNNIETDLSPDWAVAWHHEHQLTIWTSTQRAEALKAELAALLKVDAQHIHVIPHGGTKQAGFDTAVEAALLAWDLHRPVRVQAEYVPAPLAVTIYPQALSDNGKEPYQPQWAINAVSPNRPSIAASLSGLIDSLPRGLSLQTDYVSQPAAALQQYTVADPYSYTAATVFAQESYFDEYCKAQELDPLQTRIDKIKSERGQELLKQVARQADWDQSGAPADPTKQSGRGIAYSHVIDHDHNPPKETWSAWAVELNVDPQSGELSVSKLTVGHEATNLDHAAAFSPTQEALKDELGRWSQLLLGQAKQGGSKAAPSAASSAVTMPEVNLVNQSHALDQPIAWSPGAELPAAAAIANAIYNATGLRIRQTPFTLPTLLLDNETNKKPKKISPQNMAGWIGRCGNRCVCRCFALAYQYPARGQH